MILTYISPQGTSVTFSRDAPEYRLLKSYGGFAEIPASFQYDKSPGQHGTTLLDTLMDPRDIWFDVLIQTPSTTGDKATAVFGEAVIGEMVFGVEYQSNLQRLQDAIKNLSAALNPLDGDGTLYYTRQDGSRYRLNCSGRDNTLTLDPIDRSDIHQRATVTFRAHDPFWYSDIATIQNVAPEGTGWIDTATGWPIPWYIPKSGDTMDCMNEGTTDAPVTITIWGPIVEPILTNVTIKGGTTTTEVITTSVTLAEGDRLDITTGVDNETVWLTPISTGTPVKAFSYITVGSKFWLMKKGMNRVTLTCTSSTAGCGASVSWSDKYAGLL